MTAAWPLTTVPQLQDGYGEKSEKNVSEFQPEVGRPVRRRRASRSDRLITCKGWFLSKEVEQILGFYETTCKSGTLQFTMNHPRTKTPATWLFVDQPNVGSAFGLEYEVQFNLRLIAGGGLPTSLDFSDPGNSQFIPGVATMGG